MGDAVLSAPMELGSWLQELGRRWAQLAAAQSALAAAEEKWLEREMLREELERG
jgi:hypothetical protein